MTNLPSWRELQHLVVGDRLEPGQAVGGTVVAGDPHEALVVDMNAVLAFGPFIAAARSAPGLDEIARGVEHHHRRRGHGGFLGLERSRPVQSQTLSCASTAKLDGSPSFHFAGTFGHVRSTSNTGRLRGLAWAARRGETQFPRHQR